MLSEETSELKPEIEETFNKAGINDYVVENATVIMDKFKKICFR